VELELSRLRHPPPLEVLWKEAAEHAELSPKTFNSSKEGTLHYGGRRVWVGETRDSFIRRAACEAGYRAATVTAFVGCLASPVSRALQRR